MAAKQTKYIVALPTGEGHENVAKGGKAPQFATWAQMDGQWKRIGWSYGDQAKAERTAKSTIGSLGWNFAVTRVLPAA